MVTGMDTPTYAQRVAHSIRLRWRNAGKSNRDLAGVLGLRSEDHAGRKLNGKSELRLSEIEKIANELGTTPERLTQSIE